MSDREHADRIEALETLAIHLVRLLHRTGVMSDADRDQLLDSVEEICSGDEGLRFAADELAEGISPRPSTGGMAEDLMARIAYKRRLYGATN